MEKGTANLETRELLIKVCLPTKESFMTVLPLEIQNCHPTNISVKTPKKSMHFHSKISKQTYKSK